MDEWKAYSKELADISETVEEYLKYKKVVSEIEVLESDVSKETDAEMRALMEEEMKRFNIPAGLDGLL